LWAAIKTIVKAAKRIFVRVSNIALWPWNMLVKKVKRTNVRTMRYAISARSKPLFLFAMLWFPTLMFGALAWGIFSVPVKADDAWGPVAGLILKVIKNIGTLVVFVLREALPVIRGLRIYRRLTRAKCAEPC
jgi:hypothetical protein